jgi:hypothetical protein
VSHTTVHLVTEFYVNGLLKQWDGKFYLKNDSAMAILSGLPTSTSLSPV